MMIFAREHARRLALFGLLAAALGVWGVWLAHPTASLTQTALDLAQVAGRLPDVLYGRLRPMPDLLRAAVALLAVALCVVACRVEHKAVRWLLRLFALGLLLRLLPPYPDILSLWRSPDYGMRFVIAAVSLAAWGAALFANRLPQRVLTGVALVLAALALISGLVSGLALQASFVRASGLPLAPGWGLVLFGLGLLVAALGLATTLLDSQHK